VSTIYHRTYEQAGYSRANRLEIHASAVYLCTSCVSPRKEKTCTSQRAQPSDLVYFASCSRHVTGPKFHYHAWMLQMNFVDSVRGRKRNRREIYCGLTDRHVCFYIILEPFGWNYKSDFLWEKNTVPAEKTSWIRRIISQMNRAIYTCCRGLKKQPSLKLLFYYSITGQIFQTIQEKWSHFSETRMWGEQKKSWNFPWNPA
jgi:hypothetical protein